VFITWSGYILSPVLPTHKKVVFVHDVSHHEMYQFPLYLHPSTPPFPTLVFQFFAPLVSIYIPERAEKCNPTPGRLVQLANTLFILQNGA